MSPSVTGYPFALYRDIEESIMCSTTNAPVANTANTPDSPPPDLLPGQLPRVDTEVHALILQHLSAEHMADLLLVPMGSDEVPPEKRPIDVTDDVWANFFGQRDVQTLLACALSNGKHVAAGLRGLQNDLTRLHAALTKGSPATKTEGMWSRVLPLVERYRAWLPVPRAHTTVEDLPLVWNLCVDPAGCMEKYLPTLWYKMEGLSPVCVEVFLLRECLELNEQALRRERQRNRGVGVRTPEYAAALALLRKRIRV